MKPWLVSLAVTLAAIFAPIKAMLLTVLVLILADLVLGIIAAHRRGEPINSSGFKKTIIKLFVYELAIALGFLTEMYLLGETVPASKIIAGLVGTTELLSVLENLNSISQQNLLKSVLERLNQKQ